MYECKTVQPEHLTFSVREDLPQQSIFGLVTHRVLFVRRDQQLPNKDQASVGYKENIETKNEYENQEDITVVEEQNPVDVARFDKYLDAFYTKLNKNLKARMLEPMKINFEQLDKEIVYTMNENVESLDFYDRTNEDDNKKFSARRGKASKEKEKKKKSTRVGCIVDIQFMFGLK